VRKEDVPEPPFPLQAADPRDWTRAWARVLAGPPVKAVGFALLTWADYRTGADIRPGYSLLMHVTGIGSKTTVSNSLSQIRDWGFVWKYKEGNARRKEADVYRLTFPGDISAVPMMDPEWKMPGEDGYGGPCG
jgi:hypothetical protein